MNAVTAPRLLHADGRLIDDRWLVLRETEEYDHAMPTLLPLAAYLHEEPSAGLGVWLAPEDDVRALCERIDSLPLVAIEFPKLADGRGYSLATRVRTQLQYSGELRAIGEVLIDQLFMLRRVGFTSFALRADQPIDTARAALLRYSVCYQTAADGALPAFRRRAALADRRVSCE
jgi:uncharacterized protein (DUF934 family)